MTVYSILVAESFSCQRDLLLNLKNSWLRPYLKIFSCHRQHRVEILSVADHALPPMPRDDSAPQWLLAQCLAHDIQLVFVGKNTELFESARHYFEEKGIILITGSTHLSYHQQINDKYLFTQRCLADALPAIPAYQFSNVQQFLASYQQASENHPQDALCAKPVKGVFAHGFIRFKQDANFHGLFTVPVELTVDDFCSQYARVEHPPTYILMPFLTGQECSVDIACHQGTIISKATRIKENTRQKISLNSECDEICHKLVTLFQLDGLINIQFKQDQYGKWHILEINARPAGGFSYSIHTGCNLIADLIAHKLDLPQQPNTHYQDEIYVYPFTASLTEHL